MEFGILSYWQVWKNFPYLHKKHNYPVEKSCLHELIQYLHLLPDVLQNTCHGSSPQFHFFPLFFYARASLITLATFPSPRPTVSLQCIPFAPEATFLKLACAYCLFWFPLHFNLCCYACSLELYIRKSRPKIPPLEAFGFWFGLVLPFSREREGETMLGHRSEPNWLSAYY